MNQDAKKQQVLQKIVDAFSAETFPRGVELFIFSANHIFDAKAAAAALDYENWNQIPQEALIKNRDRISYLTGPGSAFCYLHF